MSTELKPGQKYPTPTRGFGDRVFYETLLKQNPNSIMAQEWCVNYGVLSTEDSSKLYKVIMKRKGKAIPSSSKNSSSRSSDVVKKKKKKVKVKSEMDAAVDVGMSTGGDETMGVVSM